MKIETTSGGYRIDVDDNAPTKRWSTDVDTVPLMDRTLGDCCYVMIDSRRDFIHAKVLG
jgi:hypothetical protein